MTDMKPWETFNIDFTNPCYLCKHHSEKPNRKKNFKCNREECEWLQVWAALQKALYEINIKNAEIERLRENTRIIMPARSQGKTQFLAKKYNAVRAEAIKEVFQAIDFMCIDTFGNFNHKAFINLKKEMGCGE